MTGELPKSDGSLRDSFWLRGIGPEYIEMAFRWAHEANPDAPLFYNDNVIRG
ncbi:MAG: endo-1,4-beta-xylanase [Anaerolineae bacterium]